MKLDVNALRYLSKEEFRVLTAVEIGQKNHEIVPIPLIDSIAALRHGGTVQCLRALLRSKLVHHDNSKYDGYRLTYLGYDFLAIKTLVNRGSIASVGRQIGVGKESDVFEVMNEDGEIRVLKLHRLGRTSFRAVKSKRDYLKHRNSFSWLYLSRLAAMKEFAFMAALEKHGFAVPRAIDHNRHAVLMSLIDAYPLVQVRELQHPGRLYAQLMDLMARLASHGLVHCDFNEFNLLVDDEEQLTLIDFPQMVSISHANAKELFERDVDCIIRFFKKKLGYIPEHDEALRELRPDFDALLAGAAAADAIDVELAASGFQRHHQEALEQYVALETETAEEEEAGDSSEDLDSCDSDAGSQNASDGHEDDLANGSDAELTAGSPHHLDSAKADASKADAPCAEREASAGPEASDSGEGSSSDDSAQVGTEAGSVNGARLVQQRIVRQQKKAAKQSMQRKVSRNAQKDASRKKRADMGAGIGW